MHMQDWRGYGIVSWNGQTLTTAWYQITLVTFPNSPNSPNAISGFIMVDDDRCSTFIVRRSACCSR